MQGKGRDARQTLIPKHSTERAITIAIRFLSYEKCSFGFLDYK